VIDLLTEYADARLDAADASVIAIAERLNQTRIATLDGRDFRVVRPRHIEVFDLLP
jgi:predicted nucleic acid-binding protein